MEEPPLADAPPKQPAAPASPLAALARAASRAEQQAALLRSIAGLTGDGAGQAAHPGAQASLQRSLWLLALESLRPAVELPESPLPAGPALPGARERLVIEICEEKGPGVLRARWRVDLSVRNPGAAAQPGFERFAADVVDALPPLACALRDLARAARAKRPSPRATLEALAAAARTLAPGRWPGLHAGVPFAWLAALLAGRLEPGPSARLAAECDAALEAAGRLRESQQSPTWELAALASVVYSRVCGALALCEELPPA